MSQFGGGGKNPPWVRQSQTMGMSQQNQIQPQIMSQMGNSAAMLQYPQAQMFQQSQLGQLQQVNTVSYPTRSLITSPFGNSGSQNAPSGGGGNPSNQSGTPKQRVFTGTVTKVQDNFGFVDEEVFFQTSCCVKGSNPQVGDRVLVEAMYNASMPFKWNATRIQVLPMDRSEHNMHSSVGRGRFSSSSYNSVPPPSEDMMSGNDNFDRRSRGGGGVSGGGGGLGSNKRNRRDDDDFDRKRRREDVRSHERIREDKEKEKERPRSPPPRKRSKTPPRRRKTRVVPRYMVQIPKIALDMPEADVLEIKKRYTNLYVPSDFFVSSFKWVEVFPPHRALTLERPCAFHVMHKDVDPVVEVDAVLDPPDADYLFCAKVMLLSMPELEEIYQKCCGLSDDKEGSHDDYRDFVHPTRLINFLVGLRGKNETMAIGGPWSPSLDGPNPDKDPTVLIKTAIRNCKALTGIDLTNCSQWYRFVEIYYHRAETVHKGKTIPARVETVVLYLPDVWNCLPTRLEWDGLHLNYKKQLDRLLNQDEEAEGDDKDISTGEIQKKEPTHYSQLDPKVMKVNELREQLEARSLSSKGLKSQLSARLAKALKTEQDKEEEAAAKNDPEKAVSKKEKEEKEEEKKKEEEEEKKKLDEKDKHLMEKRYALPEKSHILVHPSRVAKSGKFDCTVMSLSLLLDYRPEDSKEHSFEVSLFAELFNEMLMRDFGFCIYKSLVEAPEKPKEEKDDKDKSKDKDKKSDKDKRDHDDKKDDRKNEKKDDKNSVEDDDGSGDDEDSRKDRKDSDRKRKDRVKLVTADPYLLLAFVYFDQTHCGYIFDKDIEELMFTMGLNLSRAQIKKLVQKVVSRDSLHYRKLTDKPKDEINSKQNGTQTTEYLMTLALGNKKLFPIFDEGSDDNSSSKRNRKGGSDQKQDNAELPSGYVMYNGSLLDVSKLQAQFKRSEDTRIKTEKMLEKLRSDNSQLKETTSRNSSTIKKLTNELKDFKERLTNTNSELCNMDGKTKLYFSTMADIYEKLGHIVAQKQNVKDEVIEDIEMEDASDNNSKHYKRTDIKRESNVKDIAKSEVKNSDKYESQGKHSKEVQKLAAPVKSGKEVNSPVASKAEPQNENNESKDKKKPDTKHQESKPDEKKSDTTDSQPETKENNLSVQESKTVEDNEKTKKSVESNPDEKLSPQVNEDKSQDVKADEKGSEEEKLPLETSQESEVKSVEKCNTPSKATEVEGKSSADKSGEKSGRATRSRDSKVEEKKSPAKK